MLTPSTRYLVRILIAPLLIFILMRIGFWWAFKSGFDMTRKEYWTAWFLGIRYDLRVALVLALPNILLLNLRYFNPRWSMSARKFWKAYWVFVMTLVFAFYLLDFGYYDYLRTHTNATALRFLVDLSISMRMIWESYPVLKAGLVILLFAWIYSTIFSRLVLPAVNKSIENISFKQSFLNGVFAAIFIVVGLYGKFSQYPLRWSDAYFSNNAFTTALAVNPIHYFFDTLKYRKTEYNAEIAKKYAEPVRKYLGLTSSTDPLDIKRNVNPTPLEKPINVLVIVLESQAAYKTGVFGNAADPTPSLDKIARMGVLFRKHYVPSEGTARSIFGILTAIPDVNTDYTSSRNPLIASQNLILNSFTDTKKFYFLGGSTSWGNIRGLISYNIPDIEIVEDGGFSSGRNDVWGVSDLDLFKEAHKRFLAQGEQPFFAVIQTAGFHRPYTIPQDHDDFKLVNPPTDKIKDGGFISPEELNSLRFQDYSLGKFFELAQKSDYFNNTLFVIQGDHGLPDNNAKNLSKGEIFLGLSRWHVPLVFYAPKLFPDPKTVDIISSELDVMTSIASLAGRPHINTTLGRNLFETNTNLEAKSALLYTYYETPPGIALIDDQFVVKCNARLSCQGLFDYTSDTPEQDLSNSNPERFQKMQDLTFGLYEGAKYLLYNNPNPLVKK